MDMHTSFVLAQLTFSLWAALDQRRYDAVVDMMTDDGRWLRGQWQEGKAAVRASLDARPQGLVTRHVVSNFLAQRCGERFVGRHILIAFPANRVEGHEGVLPSVPPAVADVTVGFRRSGEFFLVDEVEVTPVFRPLTY